jgi:tripartite-type tricarboxylate transporter receptor subunit TctC
VRDFAPVARIATASNVLVVNNALPAQNVAELVRYAKERPGALNYASAGIGTPAHLAGEMLNLLADIKVTHIPYKGAAPGLLDVIAGNAQYIITSPIAAGAHMSAGRVRAIASTGIERNPALPELPTVADTLPGYEITQSWGIVAPAGTPVEIVKRLGDEFVKALANADVRDKILKTGAVPASNDSPARSPTSWRRSARAWATSSRARRSSSRNSYSERNSSIPRRSADCSSCESRPYAITRKPFAW